MKLYLQKEIHSLHISALEDGDTDAAKALHYLTGAWQTMETRRKPWEGARAGGMLLPS